MARKDEGLQRSRNLGLDKGDSILKSACQNRALLLFLNLFDSDIVSQYFQVKLDPNLLPYFYVLSIV